MEEAAVIGQGEEAGSGPSEASEVPVLGVREAVLVAVVLEEVVVLEAGAQAGRGEKCQK